MYSHTDLLHTTIMSPRDDRGHVNFLFGSQGRKKRQSSSWSYKPAEIRSSRQPKDSAETITSGSSRTTVTHMNSNSQTKSPSLRDPDSVPEKPRKILDQGCTMGISSPENLQQGSGQIGYPPVASGPPFIMHPFHRLASIVKQCPWMLGSDINPFAACNFSGDFYPPVPRSLMHDTAISFVVTDQSRSEQPQFIISCPLEHVGFIQSLLAPDGSQRQLSARGSSGQPREGNQLRSMLLDGTPNIELTIDNAGMRNDPNDGANGSESRKPGGPGDRYSHSRGNPFLAEQFQGIGEFAPHVQGGMQAAPPGVGGPAFSPVTWIPGLPVPPPGWFPGPRENGGNTQMPRSRDGFNMP